MPAWQCFLNLFLHYIIYYELFKLSKLLGGGGGANRYVSHPNILMGEGCPPPPPPDRRLWYNTLVIPPSRAILATKSHVLINLDDYREIFGYLWLSRGSYWVYVVIKGWKWLLWREHGNLPVSAPHRPCFSLVRPRNHHNVATSHSKTSLRGYYKIHRTALREGMTVALDRLFRHYSPLPKGTFRPHFSTFLGMLWVIYF